MPQQYRRVVSEAKQKPSECPEIIMRAIQRRWHWRKTRCIVACR